MSAAASISKYEMQKLIECSICYNRLEDPRVLPVGLLIYGHINNAVMLTDAGIRYAHHAH